MNKYKVFWKNHEIGLFEEHSMDMGYLDGIFTPNNSLIAVDFIDKAKKLDEMLVITNPTKGFRALLESEDSQIINVLVIGITSELELSLKWILGKKETLDWFITNISE